MFKLLYRYVQVKTQQQQLDKNYGDCLLVIIIQHKAMVYQLVLTPGNDGDNKEVNATENNDKSVKHEHCLSSHECDRCHGEVLDEEGADCAAHLALGAVNSNEEEEKHAEDGNT